MMEVMVIVVMMVVMVVMVALLMVAYGLSEKNADPKAGVCI